MSRFFARLRRSFQADMPQAPQVEVRPSARPLRVGFVGAFSALLGFPREIFRAFPAGWSLHVYDIEYRGRRAEYLKDLSAEYLPVQETAWATPMGTVQVADAANKARLDILVFIMYKRPAYELVDRLETPCIVQICTGLELVHHRKISFHICPQSQADYFMKDGRLFCGTTHSLFPSAPVYPGFLPCDRRDLTGNNPKRWAEREPLIVFHGSLYKAATPPFLRTIFALMQEDSRLEFVVMGRDTSGALPLMTRLAKDAGVSARLHYEGAFTTTRDAEGRVSDPGWSRVVDYLGRARLAPDPWPMIGWSARFEAMMLGAPTIHLGLRTDPGSWGRWQPVIFDSPQLDVALGTASDPADYAVRCRRALDEEAFADQLIADQLAVAPKSVDYPAYWTQLARLHDRWIDTRSTA
jgi:hypothetical protein